jgi:2-keto-4-pentenoate hydratase
LIQFAAALDTGIVATPGERGYLQRLIREAADALGEARRAMKASLRWHEATSLDHRMIDDKDIEAAWEENARLYGRWVELAEAAMAKLGEGG